ncbi:LINE-1 retrotransposable element ORF2 protein [Vitis vinifera]|uniref:LINE-1 retrotransposable element ORF2 protein n=1 Tax=Vitis vinifera TaxID=29760 RepID=A0A438HJU5_VITVI|nr:LINE-1 retrotransposable element ORF2 protein [Vitis vinifera]
MGRVISGFQNAFVEGRQILDAVLIASEAIDSVLKKKGSGLICKLDIEKAYDHVNWDFLVAILAKMGFGHKWIKWIKWCISSPCFSILINGTPSGFFQSSRGLRLGDPISLYLFVIAIEALSRLLLKAQEGGFISGFTVGGRGGDGEEISHLLFADDTIIFCKASQEQVSHLCWLLMWFEAMLGLKINLEKSEVIPVGEVDLLEELAYEIGYWRRFRGIFLWEGGVLEKKVHLIKWSTVCKAKSKGGLGVWSLLLFNKALLCKWCWRFASEGDSLWKKIIKGKFGEEKGRWRSGVVRDSFGVGVWKEIEKHWELFKSMISFAMGNRKRVKFWKDRWCSEESLCEIFPSLFALFDSKEAWVIDLWEHRGEGGNWNFRLLGT